MASSGSPKKLGAPWGYVGVTGGEVIAAYLYVASGKKTGQRDNETGHENVLALRTGCSSPRRPPRPARSDRQRPAGSDWPALRVVIDSTCRATRRQS
jgi:hypothetical protein